MRVSSFCFAVFIVFADKAFIAEGTDMLVGYFIVAFVVSACVEVADIFDEVFVEGMQTDIGGEHGEEPARPGEVALKLGVEKLAVKHFYHCICGLIDA